MNRDRLKDFIKNYGLPLFTTLASNTKIDNYPKLKSLINTTDAYVFDYDYNARSNMKYISNFLLDIKNDDSLTTPVLRMQVITNLILIKYGLNWEKEIDTFTKEYNPIDNYDMTEIENIGTDISVDTDGADNTFGFNTTSEDGVPASKNTINQTTTGDKEKNERELHRHGNVGVTTSAQLVAGELDIRTKYNIMNMIYNDIDELLTLAYRIV